MANQQKKPLTYEQLKSAFGELSAQYQKLVAEYQKVVGALNSKDFELQSFMLQAMFKVVEHIELYDEDFGKWCVAAIQEAITSLAVAMDKPEDEAKPATKEESKTQVAS